MKLNIWVLNCIVNIDFKSIYLRLKHKKHKEMEIMGQKLGVFLVANVTIPFFD
jgi:hypothetical protein